MATTAGEPRAMLLKGGPLAGSMTDWYDQQQEKVIRAGVTTQDGALVGQWAKYVLSPDGTHAVYDSEGSINMGRTPEPS